MVSGLPPLFLLLCCVNWNAFCSPDPDLLWRAPRSVHCFVALYRGVPGLSVSMDIFVWLCVFLSLYLSLFVPWIAYLYFVFLCVCLNGHVCIFVSCFSSFFLPFFRPFLFLHFFLSFCLSLWVSNLSLLFLSWYATMYSNHPLCSAVFPFVALPSHRLPWLPPTLCWTPHCPSHASGVKKKWRFSGLALASHSRGGASNADFLGAPNASHTLPRK